MEAIIDYLIGAKIRLSKKFGSVLSGVYVHGSLINNSGKGFSIKRSDIDLLITTPSNDARHRTNFLVELRPLLQELEKTLRLYLPEREFLPIVSVCVATQFELTEGVHKNRNTTNAYDSPTFLSLDSNNTSLTQVGERLREDLVQPLYFPAWAILAGAQEFRSDFVSPKAINILEEAEDFNDPFLPLPKNLLRNAYLFRQFAHLKETTMESEDDIAKGLNELCKILEEAAITDSQAKLLLELLETNSPGGRGDRKPVKLEQLLYLWELLSMKTQEAVANLRSNSEKETFKHSSNTVTRKLIDMEATTLEVVDRAISLYKASDLLQEGMLPIKIMPHKEIDLYDFTIHNKEVLTRLALEWPDDIEKYLRLRLDNQIGKSECKVGFSGLLYTQKSVSQPVEVMVRPLTYWIAAQFNKEMAAHPDDETLQKFRDDYAKKLFKRAEDFMCECPSSLYVEVAVITSDGNVLKLSKNPRSSAQSKGSGKPVFTCGIEQAFSWHSHIEITENRPQLNVKQALMDGLQNELKVHSSEVKDWSISALAIQYAHLNAALLGVARLTLTKGQITDRIDTSSGYFTKLEFLSLQDAFQAIGTDKDTGKWHQTALMRISLIDEHLSKVLMA